MDFAYTWHNHPPHPPHPPHFSYPLNLFLNIIYKVVDIGKESVEFIESFFSSRCGGFVEGSGGWL